MSHNPVSEYDFPSYEVPPEFRKEEEDWFALFNPKIQRSVDIDLVHELKHDSIVCCVRFSPDGRYLATGCNRDVYVWDTSTGEKRR